VRLTAPALGVDSAVDPVGVEPDGQMTIPAEVDRVGWYRFGPAPGDEGSAVIAGHVDDREQGLGAMAPLRDAAVGDEVVVTDAAGTSTRWRVVSREVIEKQVLPLDRLFARTGPPRLTLITCGGPFLPEYRSYRDNVVVVAEPVS
jgi:sortase (surface protein transpeptidase)